MSIEERNHQEVNKGTRTGQRMPSHRSSRPTGRKYEEKSEQILSDPTRLDPNEQARRDEELKRRQELLKARKAMEARQAKVREAQALRAQEIAAKAEALKAKEEALKSEEEAARADALVKEEEPAKKMAAPVDLVVQDLDEIDLEEDGTAEVPSYEIPVSKTADINEYTEETGFSYRVPSTADEPTIIMSPLKNRPSDEPTVIIESLDPYFKRDRAASFREFADQPEAGTAPEAETVEAEETAVPEAEAAEGAETVIAGAEAKEGETSPEAENAEGTDKETAAAKTAETETAEITEDAKTKDDSGKAEKKAKKGSFFKNRKALLALIILAALIIVIVAVLLIKGGNAKKNAGYMDQIRNQEIKLNDVSAVDDFFTNYYTALSSGNTTELEKMFDEPEKANITTEISTIVNQYDNFQIYVTPGIDDNSIVAFVYNDIHFANIDATAPSVDSFYLRYDPDLSVLKIDSDMYTDQDILKFMNLVSYREPIRTLLKDTNDKLSASLAANKDLNNLYILMQSMTDASAYETEEETTPVTEETPAETVAEEETEG